MVPKISAWFAKLRQFGRRKKTVVGEEKSEQLGRLWWITDAPLFVDEMLTRRVHDAIVWPEFQNETIEKVQSEQVKKVFEGTIGGDGEVEFKLPEFLDWLGPKLKASANMTGAATRESNDESSKTVRGEVVENDERKIYEIVVAYMTEFRERILFVDVPGGHFSNVDGPISGEKIEEILNSPPRPLVFVNIHKKSPLFPTVAEMEDGHFRYIFPELDAKLLGSLNPTPRYDDEDVEKRREYWGALEDCFKSRIAMQELEKACSPGRIGWIDFRILFDPDGRTGHLHVVPAGNAHTGVFGYNFVHRGYKHGCRVLATLKAGTDMNVLAIYER